MPRRSRLILPEVPHHVIQRGNNRDACFYADEDYQCYLQWLEEYGGAWSGCKQRPLKCGLSPFLFYYFLLPGYVSNTLLGFSTSNAEM